MSSDLSMKPTGFEGVIQAYQGDDFLQSRLIELGFVRGEKVKIVRLTPFGDRVVAVKGAAIALRREEAACLLVSA